MLSKMALTRVMHFALISLTLFRISSGLHLHFGLDHLLRTLTGGKPDLFHSLTGGNSHFLHSLIGGNHFFSHKGNSEESKSMKSDENVKADEDNDSSIDLRSSISGDSLGSIVANVGDVLNGNIVKNSLETVAGIPNRVLSGNIEGSLENAVKTASGAVSSSKNSLGKAVGDVGGSLSGSIVEDPLGTVSKKVGGTVSESIVKDSVGSVVGTASEAVGSSIIEDSVGSVAGSASEAVGSSIVEDSVESVAGTASKAVSGSIVEDSVGSVAGTASKAVSGSIVEDSVGSVAGTASKAVSGSIVEDSAGSVVGTAGEALGSSILGDSLEIVAGKEGLRVKGSISEDSSEANSAKRSETARGSILQNSLGTVDGITGDISGDLLENVGGSFSISVGERQGSQRSGVRGAQKVTRAISSSVSENPLQTVNSNSGATSEVICRPEGPATSLAAVPAVSKFVHIFYEGLQSSEALHVLFDIRTLSINFSQFKYGYIFDFFRRLGLIEANQIAAFAVRHISKKFENIVPEVLVLIYANAIPKFLYAEDLLTDNNAEQLALAYVKAFLESAESNGLSYNSDYDVKFRAICDAVFSFIFSIEQLSPSQSWELAFYFNHEWLLASLNFGYLKELSVKK